MRTRRLLLLTVVGLCAVSCQGDPSLFLHVDFDDSVTVTQLVFSGVSGNQQVFGPTTLPSDAGSPLKDDQTVRVLLPNNGQVVTVEVDGLLQGVEVASASTFVVEEPGPELDITLVLGPVDGG
jgi:hypothetical protein